MPKGDQSIESPRNDQTLNFSESKFECNSFKLEIEKTQNLNQDEKKWLIVILDEQINFFDILSDLDKQHSAALTAILTAQDLNMALEEKMHAMQKIIQTGMRPNNNIIETELNELLVALAKQKSILDNRMRNFDASIPAFVSLSISLDRIRRKLNEKVYKNLDAIMALLKTVLRPPLLAKIMENASKMESLYSMTMDRHNELKARVENNQYTEGLLAANQIFAEYNKLPLNELVSQRTTSSQVQQLNQSGAGLHRRGQQIAVVPISVRRELK